MDKKKPILQPLLAYAGKRKVLTYLSMVISGISQLLALVPFLYIRAILRDVIADDYSRIAHYGWMAVAFAIVIAIVLFSSKFQNRFNRRSSQAKVALADSIQEGLEAFQDIRSAVEKAGYTFKGK